MFIFSTLLISSIDRRNHIKTGTYLNPTVWTSLQTACGVLSSPSIPCGKTMVLTSTNTIGDLDDDDDDKDEETRRLAARPNLSCFSTFPPEAAASITLPHPSPAPRFSSSMLLFFNILVKSASTTNELTSPETSNVSSGGARSPPPPLPAAAAAAPSPPPCRNVSRYLSCPPRGWRHRRRRGVKEEEEDAEEGLPLDDAEAGRPQSPMETSVGGSGGNVRKRLESVSSAEDMITL